MAAGALDAFVTPIQMKKNRPGVMVTVLCDEPKIPTMEEILFRETTTLGVRRYPVSRHKLQRKATLGRDAVRPGEGEARLARRPPADVQPRARRLRRGPPGARGRAPRGPRRRPRRLRPARPSRLGLELRTQRTTPFHRLTTSRLTAGRRGSCRAACDTRLGGSLRPASANLEADVETLGVPDAPMGGPTPQGRTRAMCPRRMELGPARSISVWRARPSSAALRRGRSGLACSRVPAGRDRPSWSGELADARRELGVELLERIEPAAGGEPRRPNQAGPTTVLAPSRRLEPDGTGSTRPPTRRDRSDADRGARTCAAPTAGAVVGGGGRAGPAVRRDLGAGRRRAPRPRRSPGPPGSRSARSS